MLDASAQQPEQGPLPLQALRLAKQRVQTRGAKRRGRRGSGSRTTGGQRDQLLSFPAGSGSPGAGHLPPKFHGVRVILEVGDARLTVLYPTKASLAAVQGGYLTARPNTFSSPFLLEWRQARLVFGSDLERSAWPRIHLAKEVRRHHGYKVAHHGSGNAFHPEILAPETRDRPWFTTPWTRAGRRLPRFEEGHGVALILEVVEALSLTAAPFVLSVPSQEWKRQALAEAASQPDPDFPGAIVLKETAFEPLDCWIALSFTGSGACSNLRLGPRALRVQSSPPG